MLHPDWRNNADGIEEAFHRLYYDDFKNTWETTTWMGVKILKNPMDLWTYQEIIFEKRPNLIVETGTAHGGSALYFAHLMDLIGHGEVVTIDVAPAAQFPKRKMHPRLTYLQGSSTDPKIAGIVKQNAALHGLKVMVILDAAHTKEHVLAELDIYHEIVTPGQYLVVEDTNLNGRPAESGYGPGPAEALEEWLSNHPEFVVDRSRERHHLTFNPGGFLLRAEWD